MAVPPGELRISIGPASRLALEGELDLETAPELQTALDEVLANSDGSDLVLDLSKLDFVDSTGLRVMVQAMGQLREREANLVLDGPRPSTMRVLEICGLTQSVKITGVPQAPSDPADGAGRKRDDAAAVGNAAAD